MTMSARGDHDFQSLTRIRYRIAPPHVASSHCRVGFDHADRVTVLASRAIPGMKEQCFAVLYRCASTDKHIATAPHAPWPRDQKVTDVYLAEAG